MIAPMHERRRHRSEIKGQAAELYLQHAQRSFRLQQFVLANEDGLVIAASEPGEDAELLAGTAEIATASPAIHVQGVELLGQRCVLAARGQRAPDMGAAAAAMGRIFSS